MSKFRLYLEQKGLYEDEGGTTSSDIATVDSKLDIIKRNKHLDKGKKCKKHGIKNCHKCSDEYEDSKWN